MRTVILIRGAAILILILEMVILFILLLCDPATCPVFTFRRARLVTSFSTCRDLGFSVSETHPRSCAVGGKVFLEQERAHLRVWQPMTHTRVGLPLDIRGETQVGSERSIQIALLDHDGFPLLEDTVSLPRAHSGQIVPFQRAVSYPKPLGTGGTLEVMLMGGRGRSLERVRVPIGFLPVAAIEVKAFFGNSERDPKGLACDVSYPVARRVALSEDLVSAALRELLSGPTLLELRQKFFTSLPTGVALRSLAVHDGQARVEFSSHLREVAGSCRVSAIRSQIERTLKQFPFITDVWIAVEGTASGEVLQP